MMDPNEVQVREELTAAATALHEANDALGRALRIAEDLNEVRKQALLQLLQVVSDRAELLLAQGVDPSKDRLFKQLEALRETLEDL